MVTTEECYGVSVPAKAVAAILLKPKNKRGRPKKIRIFENKVSFALSSLCSLKSI